MDQLAHQVCVPLIEAPREQIRYIQAVRRQRVEWDIDSIFIEIARNVLPEVRQLKRRACEIGKRLTLRIAVPVQVKNKAADGIGGVTTVIHNGLPIRMPVHRLIAPESREEVRKGLGRNIEAAHGFKECDENRML